jgi:hypothetical protein
MAECIPPEAIDKIITAMAPIRTYKLPITFMETEVLKRKGMLKNPITLNAIRITPRLKLKYTLKSKYEEENKLVKSDPLMINPVL